MSDVLHAHTRKGTRRLLEVLNISVTLIGVIVSCVYAYVQTHQITYIKYVQVFVCQLYLSDFSCVLQISLGPSTLEK